MSGISCALEWFETTTLDVRHDPPSGRSPSLEAELSARRQTLADMNGDRVCIDCPATVRSGLRCAPCERRRPPLLRLPTPDVDALLVQLLSGGRR